MSARILTWPESRPFRILQLTDFHNDQGRDAAERTYRDIRAMVARYVPDFLAVTGDIWCGDSMPDIGASLRQRDIRFLSTLNTPWAFCWGNHDFVGDFNLAETELRAGKNACMPTGDGRGNYRIEIRENDLAVWDVFFLNSRERGFQDEDVAWLAQQSQALESSRGALMPSIVFFHLPLEQYEFARLARTVQGIAQEEVLFWENEASFFDVIKSAGAVRACFVGHSHVNDFHFETDGVVLAYGRVTGHGGYGSELLDRGAKLIELSRGGGIGFETVFPEGDAWGRAHYEAVPR